ncbi:MAG TPA: phosphate ABC transporter permease subunit PstC [Planctomycetaceae bacterium]|nr:phosphate ABC transporter permease subunit PstC [Planctomycetaceae bacterium]HRA86996.1 phosphate ABC transporter permease subunit PstC [Planctomycetaceae bacterium]
MAESTSPAWAIQRGSRRHEKLIQAALFLCAALSVFTTAAIILVLLTNAVYAPGAKTAFFERVSLWEFLTDTHWKPVDGAAGRFGIIPLLSGTMMVAVIASLVSVPAGLGAAIYMSEYAAPRERELIKPFLEILAGIPSVIYGFFALKFITPWILKPIFELFGFSLGTFNVLSAGIVVGIMVTPLIASLSEDVIRSVPRSLREAAYALGSTRFDVSVRVVVPAALSGILAAFLLAFSRAIGETMAVAIAGGQMPIATLNPLQGAQTITGFMVHASTGDSAADSISRMSVYAVGISLFVITLSINLISGWILRRYREVYQ